MVFLIKRCVPHRLVRLWVAVTTTLLCGAARKSRHSDVLLRNPTLSESTAMGHVSGGRCSSNPHHTVRLTSRGTRLTISAVTSASSRGNITPEC